jgi:hypothetical protein
MIQIILTIIEDLIMAFFIYKYLNLKSSKSFIVVTTLSCSLETTLVEYIPKLSVALPFIMFITILLIIYLYKKNIVLNNVIISLLGPITILLSDIFSLVLLNFIQSFPINDMINAEYFILTASITSKFIEILIYMLILYFNSYNKIILNFKDWWMLLPIWIIIFYILYLLGESIVFNNVNIKIMYTISIFLLILSVFFLILFYKIQKENEIKYKNKLLKQKEYYMKTNYEMIKKMHNEMTELEHSNIYNFLYIKGLLFNNKEEEIESFLNQRIYKLKKFKNINSGNPYFDYVLNKTINNIITQNGDVKTFVQIENNNFEIKKNQLDAISSTIEFLFNLSDKKSSLHLEIIQKKNYIIFTLIYNNIQINSVDHKTIQDMYDNTNKISYSHKEIDTYNIFKILIETETMI